MTPQEALDMWRSDTSQLAARGVVLPGVRGYIADPAWKQNYTLAIEAIGPQLGLAMDAIPSLVTDPNSGIPAFLTTLVDPDVFNVVFAPNKGAAIVGEERKGTWIDQTTMFPVVEHTGEVTTYGDFNDQGHAGANTNWPQRQSYVFQTIKEYGDQEIERAGLGRINWVSQLDMSAATVLAKFLNYSYFFGISGLQNYGLLNDPNLPAALAPGPKLAGGGNRWILANGTPNGSANEIFADIQAMFYQLVANTTGLVDAESPMTLAMSPQSAVALTITNSFNVKVRQLIEENFPKMRIETAVQYGQTSAQNPQGITAGNLVQLIADRVDGQKTAFCAFNDKMRSFPIVRQLSSYKQKVVSGTWGAVIRMPVGFTQMIGV